MPSSKTKHVAECHGIKVPASPMLNETRIERINTARYEGQEIVGALSVIRPGDRVLEMGAGIGLVGAIAARNGKPEKIISFEANPDLIPHIKALYAMNRLGKKIEVRNEVLVSAPDAPETMPFHILNSYLGSSLLERDNRASRQVDVPTARYASLHKDYAPDVLLMDIEGGELEFLRHATLDGIRAIVIEFHPEAYGREGMRECKNILRKAGFRHVPEHSTRQVWTCVHDPAQDAPVPDSGWSRQITTFDNAVVVPPAETGFVQATGILTAQDGYVSSGALWRNGRALTTQPALPEGNLPLRKGTWLWGGLLWMHFGHFLAESSARLWALEECDERIDGILFVPKRPKNGSEIIDFQRDFVCLMEKDIEIACCAAPERVERLIVPGQGFGLGLLSSGTDLYRNAMRRRFGTTVKPQGSERLYISRSQLPAGRGTLIGESELESHLAAEGYQIYHPQKHSLEHQIATYKAARQIIAAEGSALHLVALVANPKAEVAIIVRRPSGATRNLERHISSFTGRSPVMVQQLARSWKPLGKARPRLWMGELDLPAVQADLVSKGFVQPGSTAWQGLDPRDVLARLGDKFEEVA